MFEAIECFVCSQVLALFGADASRCPGCGSVHGRAIRRAHVNGTAQGQRGKRATTPRKRK
jgi:phage FluMu protein Com